MPWATSKDKFNKKGKRVRYQYTSDKANLPKELTTVESTQKTPSRAEILSDRRFKIDGVSQRPAPKAEEHWIKFLVKELKGEDSPPSLTKDDKAIVKHVNMLSSENVASRLEGTIWLRRNHSDVLKQYYRIIEEQKTI